MITGIKSFYQVIVRFAGFDKLCKATLQDYNFRYRLKSAILSCLVQSVPKPDSTCRTAELGIHTVKDDGVFALDVLEIKGGIAAKVGGGDVY